jgi:hypothetical protein
MEKKSSKKEIAGLTDPTIEAIVGGLFRFSRESQAVSLLQRLSRNFLISDDQDPVPLNGCPTLKLWIHGFSVTESEHEKGFIGHFARLKVKTLDGGKVTIVAEKISSPLANHPMKKAPKRQNPNGGHRLVRAAMRGKIYDSLEQLRTELLEMHEEFPETTIPGNDKILFMLYSRTSKPPLRKVRLSIVPVAAGGYTLELADYVKKPTVLHTDKQVENAPVAPKAGKFESMVKLQRKRRKPIKSKKTQKTSSSE